MTINPSFVKKLVGGVNQAGETELKVLLLVGLPMYSVQSVIVGLLTAPTNEFVGFYPIAPNGAINGYRDSPSRSMFCAAFSSLS